MYYYYPNLFKILRLTFARRFFSLRHACIAVLFIVLFLLLRVIVWTVRLLDHLFFPAYKKQKIVSPIYIIGNPRSGTTFTHRLISKDKRFTYFELFHTIFPTAANSL